MAPIIRGNSLYTIIDGPSWTQAEANAVKLGGHLTAITSQEEDAFVQGIANKYFQNLVFYQDGTQRYYLRDGQEQSSDIWIGLNDSNHEGQWEWTSFENVSYLNDSGLFDDSGLQDYCAIRQIWNWAWDDQENTDINNFLFGRGDVRYSGKVGISEIPFIRRGDSAYVIVQGPSWEEAEANAVKLGGHLVTINDAAENEWLSTTYGKQTDILWIGYSDRISEGSWKWSDNDKSSYTNWNPFHNPVEPNGGAGENYAAMICHLNPASVRNALVLATWADIWNTYRSSGLAGIAEMNSHPTTNQQELQSSLVPQRSVKSSRSTRHPYKMLITSLDTPLTTNTPGRFPATEPPGRNSPRLTLPITTTPTP